MDGMPDLYAYDLEMDTHGNIWCGTDGGAAICTRKGNSVEIKVINYSKGLPDNIVKGISAEKNNTVWLATEDAGLVSFDLVTQKINPLQSTKWTYGSITDILALDGWMWVGTSQGLMSADLTDKTVTLKVQTSDPVTTLFNDVEGSIWVGSKNGVERTLGKQLQFLDLDVDANVIAVTADWDGAIWYSTALGLFKRQFIDGKVITSKPLANTPYVNKSVISLHTDTEGFVWAGLYGEGVLRLHPKTYAIKSFNKELRNGSVLNISGKGNSIWLATLGGASEIRMDKNFAVKNYSTSDGLATDYIYQVFTDSKERVWF